MLWQHELDAELLPESGHDLDTRGRLDPPRMFAAYLNALRWHCVTSTERRLLQAPFRAGIDLKTYQLEPLRKALELPRVNLLIADDVGLGKTIEAGLILQELLLRQRVERVLVVAPPAVTLQWQEELEQRFGLPFALYNSEFVAARRRERGWGVNPWTTHTHFIVSYALLRGQRSKKSQRTPHLELLLNALRDKAERSLLILDECHQVAPAGGSVYPVDTRTTRSIRQLAHRFEHRLFLSATPHNGHSYSFTSLLHLLDPQRFTRGLPITGAKELAPIMVRRLKRNLRKEVGGLPERILVDHELPVPESDPEIQLGVLLGEYEAKYRLALKELSDKQRAARSLVIITLHKRLLSSVNAFHRTLQAHARGVGETLAASRQTQLPTAPDRVDSELSEDELDTQEDAWVQSASLTPGDQALALLKQMQTLSGQHRMQPDARSRALASWIKNYLRSGKQWNHRRVVVFTEYEATLSWLERVLPGLIGGDCTDRIARYTGRQSDTTREQLKAAFNSSPASNPLRVLLCTDAAREGINLQAHCADLFHFDLPWNPSRIEQRNGRIDRVLQPSPQVRCHYFVIPARPEDKVLTYVVRKLGVIREELGSLSEVVSAKLAARMEQGLRDLDTPEIDRLATPGDKAMAAQAELEDADASLLRGDLDALRGTYERSEKRLNFRIEHLQDAVDLGLRIATGSGDGLGPGLLALPEQPSEQGQKPIPTFQLPDLDPSWDLVLDNMRERPQPDAKPWDRPPIKPVAFRAAHRLDAPTTQLHLGHPLVKRLLARFRAQGFAADDLCRATLIHNDVDSVRRVLAIGRLSLFGQGATRLHEDLIIAEARCTQDGVQPYSDSAGRITRRVLDELLAHNPAPHPSPEIRAQVAFRAEEDYAALWPLIAAQAQEDQDKAEKLLHERGQSESAELSRLLDIQATRIQAGLGELAQLSLGLDAVDQAQREQLRRDREHMENRLKELDGERASEPKSIRDGYAVALRRLEPVGIIYLWPSA